MPSAGPGAPAGPPGPSAGASAAGPSAAGASAAGASASFFLPLAGATATATRRSTASAKATRAMIACLCASVSARFLERRLLTDLSGLSAEWGRGAPGQRLM